MKNTKIKTRIKVNDNVVVTSGTDRGRRGKVLKIDKERGRIVVEGINKRNKYVKASQENPKGRMITLEFPVSISKVMVFCEKCKKPVRIGIQIKDKDKTRVCMKCGKSLEK